MVYTDIYTERSMTFDDVISHFSDICVPRGNLVR